MNILRLIYIYLKEKTAIEKEFLEVAYFKEEILKTFFEPFALIIIRFLYLVRQFEINNNNRCLINFEN
jgi:hypothetical protein